MAIGTWPVLARKRPFAVGRSFNRRFGARRRIEVRRRADRHYRDAVEGILLARYGVPLPTALDWLAAAAWRRSVPVEALADFLAKAFDLEPLTGR